MGILTQPRQSDDNQKQTISITHALERQKNEYKNIFIRQTSNYKTLVYGSRLLINPAKKRSGPKPLSKDAVRPWAN